MNCYHVPDHEEATCFDCTSKIVARAESSLERAEAAEAEAKQLRERYIALMQATQLREESLRAQLAQVTEERDFYLSELKRIRRDFGHYEATS